MCEGMSAAEAFILWLSGPPRLSGGVWSVFSQFVRELASQGSAKTSAKVSALAMGHHDPYAI
jgi:hypothetical protein